MSPQSSFLSLKSSVDLKKIKVIAIQSYFNRVISLKRSSTPLSTTGAVLTGGRYNYMPAGKESFPTLYCSDNNITAVKERYGGLVSNQPISPYTTVAVKVNLSRVWDLSSKEKCEAAEIDWEQINDNWEFFQDILKTPAYSQQIGTLAYQSQAEGIKFESTKDRGHYNLAIFTDFVNEEMIQLHDPDGQVATLFASLNQ